MKLKKFSSPFADLPQEVAVATIVAFFVALGFGLIIPAIPIFAKTFGVSNTAIGFVISMFAITRLASGLPSGKFVERFGERITLAAGLFMVAFFVFLTGFAQSYEQLLFFRAAGGLGSAMFSVAAGSLILRSVGSEKRGRALSVFNGGFLIGSIAGPAFGGVLIAISPRAPFFIYAITLSIAGSIALVFLHESRLANPTLIDESSPVMTISEAFKIKAFRYMLIISFLVTWALFGVRSSILPLYVVEDLNGTITLVGIGFTISALAQGLILIRAGRFSDSNGRKPALLIGLTTIAIGLLILIFAINVEMYLIAMVFIGLGGAFGGTATAIVGDVIHGRSGKVVAISQMAGDAGMMVGPILLGFISDIASYQIALAATTAAFSIAIFLVFAIPETRKLEKENGSSPIIREEPH